MAQLTPRRPQRFASSGGGLLVEVIRLLVVVLATAAALDIARSLPESQQLLRSDTALLLMTLLGASLGYVLGGIFGRFTMGRIDAAERSLRGVSAVELLSGVLGGFMGLLVSSALVWPILFFDGKVFTIPLAALVVLVTTATGLRVGRARGGDLLRFLGASGRLAVTSPSQGSRAKILDTSALIDGRILDVCRAGFLDGTLVLPTFVLSELQGLADAGDEDRRSRGKRGLDVLAALQRSSGVALEVSDRDYPEIEAVDAKLVALARDRKSALVTVDGNLGRVAEIQGLKVLNLHTLAEQLRPPVLPGDMLSVRIMKTGKEPGQGVGYLSDGTMVVVEGGRDHQGAEISAEVTSILSNSHGRLVFATYLPARERAVTPLSPRARGAD